MKMMRNVSILVSVLCLCGLRPPDPKPTPSSTPSLIDNTVPMQPPFSVPYPIILSDDCDIDVPTLIPPPGSDSSIIDCAQEYTEVMDTQVRGCNSLLYPITPIPNPSPNLGFIPPAPAPSPSTSQSYCQCVQGATDYGMAGIRGCGYIEAH